MKDFGLKFASLPPGSDANINLGTEWFGDEIAASGLFNMNQ